MKILYVTTIGTTMTFFKSLISDLICDGNEVDIACNSSLGSIPREYGDFGCKTYDLSCTRSPFNFGNLKSIFQIREIAKKGDYDIIHCHTPIASICARIACKSLRKSRPKVFYTAHGFHFYKGAPVKNWILFFFPEWFCSFFTDVLITINHEDYYFAKKHLHANAVEFIPGVGVDIKKIQNTIVDRAKKREEIGVPKDAFLLVSVGELNKNKNHQIVIQALAELHNPKIHYIIAGEGDLHCYLEDLAFELGVFNQVHVLGFRNDVAELFKSADLNIFPSIREGLGLASIEGMAAGLPTIAFKNRGTREYIRNGFNGFFFKNKRSLKKQIVFFFKKNIIGLHMKKNAEITSWSYDYKEINKKMKRLYLNNN